MASGQERQWKDEWAGLTSLVDLVKQHPLCFGVLTVLCAAVGFVAASTRAPEFESSLYIGLEDWRVKNPVLDGLAIPGGTQDTKDAYSVLRSQEVLALVVSDSTQGPESFRLGLQTEISVLPLTPWQRIKREGRGAPKLEAQVLSTNPDAIADWVVRFESENAFTITNYAEAATRCSGPFATAKGESTQTFTLPESGEISYLGAQLRIAPGTNVAGRAFRIRHISAEKAIAKLRGSLRVQIPGERNQVVKIVAQDGQAVRAQKMVEAVSLAFFHFEESKAREGAESVVTYLESEISERKSELDGLDSEIANRRAGNPDLLHPEQSTSYLQNQRLEVLAELDRLDQTVALLDGVVRDLDSGTRTTVHGIRVALAEPRLDRWLDQVDELEAEMDLGPDRLKNALQVSLLEDLRKGKERLRMAQRNAAEFDRHLSAFRAGDEGRLAAILENLTEPGSPPPQNLYNAQVAPYQQSRVDLANLQEQFKDKHPSIEPAKTWVTTRRDSLVGALDARLQVMQELVGTTAEDVQLIRAQLDGWPTERQLTWEQAQAGLWAKIDRLLRQKQTYASARQATLRKELEQLDARRLRLPTEQTALQVPTMERDGLHAKIDRLITKREDAEIALAGLRPGAQVLEPALEPSPRQPHLVLLGIALGGFIGLLLALTSAQFLASRNRGTNAAKKPIHKSGPASVHPESQAKTSPYAEAEILVQMPQRSSDHTFALGHPLRPDMKGMAFAAMRRLRVQLNSMSESGFNTSLLGIAGLGSSFGEEQSASFQNARQAGGILPQPSLAAATIGALALTHVLANKRVLIVDACAGRNGLSTCLGMTAKAGLSDVLADDVLWKTSIVHASSTNLDILPAGQASPMRSRGSEAWSRLILEVVEEYDVVLVLFPSFDADSPTLDALPLLGGILGVCDTHNMPTSSEVTSQLAPVRQTGARIVGLLQANRGGQTHARVDVA